MKKILAIVILSSTTIYALGGINETTIEGGTTENGKNGRLDGEATNNGTTSGAGDVRVGAGMLNTQAGNASRINIKNHNIKNNGTAKLRATNNGSTSGGGSVRVGAGIVNVQ